MPIWETLSLKNEGTASNLGSRTRSVGFGSSSSKFGLLQDTASSVKKVLSFYGDRQPLSAENFALYFDMIDAQLLITDSEKPKKRLGSFLLAWLKRHTGLPLLTPASVWDLVRSARNRRFTFTSMKLSFQVRASSRRFWRSWRNILYLKLFCILQWITGAGEGIRRATRGN